MQKLLKNQRAEIYNYNNKNKNINKLLKVFKETQMH